MNVNKDKVNLSQIPLSPYAKQHDPIVQARYAEKISPIGIDPVLVQAKYFQSDCLPPVESTDAIWC